jgi:hypothetical protein
MFRTSLKHCVRDGNTSLCKTLSHSVASILDIFAKNVSREDCLSAMIRKILTGQQGIDFIGCSLVSGSI